MAFEWDERKNVRNFEVHGISFEDAPRIFGSPALEFPVVEFKDERRDYGEDRMIALGKHGPDLIAVVYTWRGRNRRIISARRASGSERKEYQTLFEP